MNMSIERTVSTQKQYEERKWKKAYDPGDREFSIEGV